MIPGAVSSPLIQGREREGPGREDVGVRLSEDPTRELHGMLQGLKEDGGATGRAASSSRARKERRRALPEPQEEQVRTEPRRSAGRWCEWEDLAPSGGHQLATHKGQGSGEAVGGGLWEELVQASQD